MLLTRFVRDPEQEAGKVSLNVNLQGRITKHFYFWQSELCGTLPVWLNS